MSLALLKRLVFVLYINKGFLAVQTVDSYHHFLTLLHTCASCLQTGVQDWEPALEWLSNDWIALFQGQCPLCDLQLTALFSKRHFVASSVTPGLLKLLNIMFNILCLQYIAMLPHPVWWYQNRSRYLHCRPAEQAGAHLRLFVWLLHSQQREHMGGNLRFAQVPGWPN
jgi:hypothetical protein